MKKLSVELKEQVFQCIDDLARDPLPQGRRPHRISVNGTRPIIYSLDLTGNKSHKLTFTVEGNVATLRRVGTHREIDRQP